MTIHLLQPIVHPPQPSLNYSSIIPYNQIPLFFRKPKPKRVQEPVNISQPKNLSTLSLVDYKPLNTSTYAAVLDSCRCPELGKQVHAHTIKAGFHGDEFVDTKLLQMYARCGLLNDADVLFEIMTTRNLFSWKAIISVYSDHGLFEEAVLLFQELLFDCVELDFFVFPLVLKVCSGVGSVELGKQLHGLVIKFQFCLNIYVSNALINMYGKSGSLDDAKKVLMMMAEKDSVSWNSVITACAANGMVYEALEFLEKMKSLDYSMPNLVSWSAVIGGFAQNGYDKEAIEMLFRMQLVGLEPNAQTLASVLPACARLQRLELGKEFHGYITRNCLMSNPVLVNALVDVYRRCGDMGSAINIFLKFSVKNVLSCNTLIVGYCEIGEVSKAKELFDYMDVLGIEKDIISWNSMISGFVDNFMFNEALDMFWNLLMEEGIEPNSFTIGSVLTACANTTSLRQGLEIHSQAIVRGLQSDRYVGGALVEMYSKCQDLAAAQMAFDGVMERDVPTWNALISGYACCNQIERIQNLIQSMKEDGYDPNIYTWNSILAGLVENGHLDLAMQWFSEMQTSSKLRPDIYTVGAVLPACSRLTTLERGKQAHAHSIRCGYDSNVYIGAALVDMYAKCGSLNYAQLVYDRISNPNLVSHNALLNAYAMHGHGEEGIALFRRILALGFRPDHVTFLSVLSSCVHAGSIETGLEFFDLMGYYNLKPTLKHYTSMVDLLSRSGKLHEAYEFIKKMPVEPDSVLWSALLGSCVTHGNIELGEIAAEKLTEFEPEHSGNYVLLANLYAYAKRWSDLATIRGLMEDKGMYKNPGYSWIEYGDEIHSFRACDRSHKRAEEIYSTLDNLALHMKMGIVCIQ